MVFTELPPPKQNESEANESPECAPTGERVRTLSWRLKALTARLLLTHQEPGSESGRVGTTQQPCYCPQGLRQGRRVTLSRGTGTWRDARQPSTLPLGSTPQLCPSLGSCWAGKEASASQHRCASYRRHEQEHCEHTACKAATRQSFTTVRK